MEKENIKRFNRLVEKADKTCILVSDTGIGMSGATDDLLMLFGILVNDLVDSSSEEIVRRAFELAMKDEDGLFEGILNTKKDLN